MITRNCVLVERPTEVGLKGVECYCLGDSKMYQQITGPHGNRWEAVGSKIVMTGQMIVSFLLGNDQGIIVTGTALENTKKDPIPLIVALG